MRTEEHDNEAMRLKNIKRMEHNTSESWNEDDFDNDEMTEFEKELWSFVSEDVLEATDQKKAADTLSAQWDKLIEKTSTLGGYLQDVRELNELSLELCADKASVPVSLWQDWENDQRQPSDAQMKSIALVTFMGTRKQREFTFLKATDPLEKLALFCGLVRNKVAAETSPVTVRHQIWGWLPSNLRTALLRWGDAQGQKMPEYLSTFVRSLKSKKEERAWAQEILAGFM